MGIHFSNTIHFSHVVGRSVLFHKMFNVLTYMYFSNSTQIWLESPFDLIQCYQITWLFMNCLNLFTEDSFLYVLNRYWSSKYIVSTRHCCQCEHGYQWKYSRLDGECLWHCWWCRQYHLLDWNQCWHSRSDFRGLFRSWWHTGDM